MALTIDEREMRSRQWRTPGDGGSPFRQILVPVRSPAGHTRRWRRRGSAPWPAACCAWSTYGPATRRCAVPPGSTGRRRRGHGRAGGGPADGLGVRRAAGHHRRHGCPARGCGNRGVSRIGPTGASQFFMDLTFDPHGNMLGETSTLSTSAVPAMYTINPAIGTATKLFDLTGSSAVMGRRSAATGSSAPPITPRTRASTGSAQRPGLRPRSPPCPSASPAASN